MTVFYEVFHDHLNTFNTTIENISANEYTLKHYLTPAILRKYESGEMGHETAVQKAVEKFKREHEKDYRRTLDTDEKILLADLPSCIEVYVSWKRSYAWGKNPTAEVYASGASATGKASGCGYDKESAAVAAALNKIPACRAVLAEKKEKYLSENGLKTAENHKAIGYGSGYGPIPAFENGVGMSCIIGLMKECGYSCNENHKTNSDIYIFTKNC